MTDTGGQEYLLQMVMSWLCLHAQMLKNQPDTGLKASQTCLHMIVVVY